LPPSLPRITLQIRPFPFGAESHGRPSGRC
jgi:hypothetical protein